MGESRETRAGVLFWLAFCLAAVVLRGMRWDETYEHAQALLGTTPYPPDHPFYIMQWNSFTVNGYLSALLLRLTGSAAVVCGFRNCVQLAMSIVPVFLLGAFAGRRALAGHLAALFVALGSLNAFASYYPLAVWPNGFSNGPLGQGWALLVLYALLTGRIRTGYFMLGLMPVIHIGQAPIVCIIGGLFALRMLVVDRAEFRRAFVWGLAGLLPCVVFYAVYRIWLTVPLPTSGPYYSSESADAIWKAYSALYDVHGVRPRFQPLSHRNMVLIGMLILGAWAMRDEQRNGGGAGPFTWCWVYGLCAAAIMWTVSAVQSAFGAAASFWLLVWMPHRLSNHVALLLLVVCAALLTRREEERTPAPGHALAAALLFYAALLPVFRFVVPESIYAAYLGGAPESIAFALWGAACAVLMTRTAVVSGGARRWIRPALFLAGLAVLAQYHQLGALCVLAGALFVCAAHICHAAPVLRLRAMFEHRAAAVLLVAAVAGAILVQEARTREHLPVSGFERDVTAYLADRGEGDAMLLAPFWQIYLQAKTNHPVFADYQTAHWMTYLPALGPALKKMHLDLFGKRIDAPYEQDLNEWVARPAEAWRTLAQEYRFRYVIAPEAYPLLIEEVFRRDGMVFYRIPGV